MKHLFLPPDSLRDLSDDFFDEKYDLGGDIFDLFCHILNQKDDIFHQKGHSEH